MSMVRPGNTWCSAVSPILSTAITEASQVLPGDGVWRRPSRTLSWSVRRRSLGEKASGSNCRRTSPESSRLLRPSSCQLVRTLRSSW
jgi:hypothetical protein